METTKVGEQVVVTGCGWCEKQETIDEADRVGGIASHGICLECKARVLATLFEN